MLLFFQNKCLETEESGKLFSKFWKITTGNPDCYTHQNYVNIEGEIKSLHVKIRLNVNSVIIYVELKSDPIV